MTTDLTPDLCPTCGAYWQCDCPRPPIGTMHADTTTLWGITTEPIVIGGGKNFFDPRGIITPGILESQPSPDNRVT